MLKGCGNPGTETENETINIGKYWQRKLEITGTDHWRILVPKMRDIWHQTGKITATEHLENIDIEKEKN
jgi:hypothetical protein